MDEKVKLIECSYCESKVSASVIATHEYRDVDGLPGAYYFLLCPICNEPMVGVADLEQVGYNEWNLSEPVRLWPEPPDNIHRSIPKLVSNSIHEAKLCLKATAFSACTVMCGRALEAICKEQLSKKIMLAKGLKELKDKKIIDGRIYLWGETLRKRRNISAHPSEEDTTKEDATDILSFTTAICEYIYVLTIRYEEFIDREKNRKNK